MINSDKIYFIKNKNKYLPSLPVITQLNKVYYQQQFYKDFTSVTRLKML